MKPNKKPIFKLKVKKLFNLCQKIKHKYPKHYKFIEHLYNHNGVDILRDESIPKKSQPNYPIKDYELASKLTEKLIRYLKKGALIGPFTKEEIPFKTYFLSPLTGIWKKYPKKVSLIQNLSAPKNDSINSSIPKENRSTEYLSFVKMIGLADAVGKNGYLHYKPINKLINLNEPWPFGN